jgi:hypothetical protein
MTNRLQKWLVKISVHNTRLQKVVGLVIMSEVTKDVLCARYFSTGKARSALAVDSY